jgi:hypothetical protein
MDVASVLGRGVCLLGIGVLASRLGLRSRTDWVGVESVGAKEARVGDDGLIEIEGEELGIEVVFVHFGVGEEGVD